MNTTSNYNTILFDLDGTLTDPFEGITKSFVYALNAFGIDEPDRNVLRRVIGPPLIYSFKEYYGFDDVKAQRAVVKYRERFSKVGLYENRLYDGVEDMLKALKDKGITLAVASSKAWVYVEQILEHFNIDKYFSFISGCELDQTRSEKDEVIEHAISSLGITDRSKILMVGDRKYDLIGAQSTGIDVVGVLYGYGDIDELSKYPTVFIADSVSALKKYLQDKA